MTRSGIRGFGCVPRIPLRYDIIGATSVGRAASLDGVRRDPGVGYAAAWPVLIGSPASIQSCLPS
jgi:hypothetical protein